MAEPEIDPRAKRIAANAARLDALRKKAEQAQNLLRAVESIAAEKQRAADTRRKTILGALVIDALARGTPMPLSFEAFMARVSRDHDRKAFEGWTPAEALREEPKTPRTKSGPSAAAPDAATEGSLPATTDAFRAYFQVPYAQKGDAKQLGMSWDGQRRLWYAPSAAIASQAALAYAPVAPESDPTSAPSPRLDPDLS